MSKSFILFTSFVKIVIAKDVYIGREEVEKKHKGIVLWESRFY